MRTLGTVVLDWMEVLPSPSDRSKPFIASDDQALFVKLWYGIDDSGAFIYRRGLLEQAKGWGKSPLGSAIAIAEFAGPVVFDGFDAAGQPVGRPWGTGDAPPPWVQIAASSEDQANSNVYSLIWAMLTENEAVLRPLSASTRGA